MTKQQAKEQRRKAKRLARVLGHREFGFANSLFVPGDGIIAVRISVYWNGKEYQANGGSKCNRIDPWNEEIGLEIATGRALLRIAYQILKEEQQEIKSLTKEVMQAFKDFQEVLGTEIYEDKSQALAKVPGTAKYRGSDQMQYGWGVIQPAKLGEPIGVPEVVPTGLEVMKEKGMLEDDRGDKAEGQPE